MSKWQNVPEKRKKEIFEFNKQRAENKEASEDLYKLLSALPSGQKKQLLKDEICGQILAKYGITGE